MVDYAKWDALAVSSSDEEEPAGELAALPPLEPAPAWLTAAETAPRTRGGPGAAEAEAGPSWAGPGGGAGAEGSPRGRLGEFEGAVFGLLLDFARYNCEASVTRLFGCSGLGSVVGLHDLPASGGAGAAAKAALQLRVMLAKAYTYWDRVPGGGEAVLGLCAQHIEFNIEREEEAPLNDGAFLRELRELRALVRPGGWAFGWGRPAWRVHGTFVAVEYLEDGLLAVLDRGEGAGDARYAAYVIAGCTSSLEGVLQSAALPLPLRATILAYNDRWVCDDVYVSDRVPGRVDLAVAAEAADLAMREGRVHRRPPPPPREAAPEDGAAAPPASPEEEYIAFLEDDEG